MDRADIETALAQAIDVESRVGIVWWHGADMAPIALRRWTSFDRRNKTNRPALEDRILDLAKGLQTHFEPGVARTSMSEWLHLAGVMSALLSDTMQE